MMLANIALFASLLIGSGALRMEVQGGRKLMAESWADSSKHVNVKRSLSDSGFRETLINPYPSFTCGGSAKENAKYSTDTFLEKNGNTWPKELFESMLNTRIATHFQHHDGPVDSDLRTARWGPVEIHNESTVKFCEMKDVEARFKSVIVEHDGFKASREMILDASKSIPVQKDKPVVFLDGEVPGSNADGLANLDSISNSLCALRRVGLSNRTVVYFTVLKTPGEHIDSLKSLFPEVVLVVDTQLKSMLHELDGEVSMLRWVPVLHLLDMGHTVLHIDADNHVVGDPVPLLHSAEEADVGFAYEDCLGFNGGTNFFRPTEPTKGMLRTLLSLRAPRLNESLIMRGADQAYIGCAVAHAVVKFNLKVHVIPKSQNAFHWSRVSDAVQELCYDGVHRTVKDFPVFMHTSGASSPSRKSKMKQLGLWERSDESGGCVENFDPAATCNKGISVAKKDLTKYLYADA